MSYKNDYNSVRRTISQVSSSLSLPLTTLASLALLMSASAGHAQEIIPQLMRTDEGRADITLDGRLDESVWQQAPAIDGMRVITPDTMADASLRTEARIFYTERGIYVGVMNFQDPASLVARMTPRDTRLERDGVVISIDASGEGLYGYMMRVNLGGSKTDGTILPERSMNMQWDGSWDAETSEVAGGWSAEYFIPWTMMALPRSQGDSRQIGIYLERQVGHLNETWSTPALPSTVNEFLSAFQKFELENIEPRTQLTWYPYISTAHDAIRDDTALRAGAEVFWRPTTNTQLSASLNPDFGNVESDDVVVNLTAFEVFFPEKRAFFLEGQDVFATSPRNQSARGPGGPTTMLNTRRIGSAALYQVPTGVRTVATDLSAPSDLIAAAKFTGQNGSWRYGTLIASEDDMDIRGVRPDGSVIKLEAEGRDFSVGRLLYEDTVGGGRRSIGWMGTSVSHSAVDAVVNGIDMHYFSADTRWIFDGQVVNSDVNGVQGNGAFADIVYQPQRGQQHRIAAGYHDDKLELNTLGFLTRNDLMHLDYNYTRNESNIEGLRSRSSSLFIFNQWNGNDDWVRQGIFGTRNYTYLNNHSAMFSLRYYHRRVDDRLGRGTGDFYVPGRWQFVANWETDPAQPLRYTLGVDANSEELGEKFLTTSAGVNYRPVSNFSVALDLSYAEREGLLVHRGNGRYTSYVGHQWSPKFTLDYFIDARQQLRFGLQWTGLKAFENKFLQVNRNSIEQLREVPKPNLTDDSFVISRLTFQARYRWEIAPLSDLFVVYTRGGNTPGSAFDDYSGMFAEAWSEPVLDTLVVKLRYRFGT
jgi:hypothetical protein